MEGATINDRREPGGHCRRGRESFAAIRRHLATARYKSKLFYSRSWRKIDILEKGKGRGVIPTERMKGSPALPRQGIRIV